MATTTIDFAWAIPVEIVRLGSHLEAYDKLQPSINALRLCNRFGRGEQAAITKLPVELVHRVEDYLMAEERFKLFDAWARDLTCWEGECRPIEHMGNADILEYYNDWLGNMSPGPWVDTEFCESCGDFHQKTELTVAMVETVAQLMEDNFEESGDNDPWCKEHGKRVLSWFKRVGAPTDRSRGSFDRLSAILRKHFGLELWSSHVQEENRPQFQTSHNNHSTKVYLRLPTKSYVQYEVEPDLGEFQDHRMREKTEAGFAGVISLPPNPAAKCLEKFARAVKALDLWYVPSKPSTSTLIFKTGKKPDNSLGGEDRVLPSRPGPPQLTMFVRADDPTEDL